MNRDTAQNPPMIGLWLGEVSGFPPANSATMPQAVSITKNLASRPDGVFDHPDGQEPSAAPAASGS
jgi:hypothetical protein